MAISSNSTTIRIPDRSAATQQHLYPAFFNYLTQNLMRIRNARKRPLPESSSDSSEGSLRVQPPTAPNSPKHRLSTVLTRGCLHQITMHARNPNGNTQAYLEVDSKGRRPADELFGNFHLDDRRKQTASQAQGYGNGASAGGQTDQLAAELEALDRAAYYSRIDRVTKQAEAQRAGHSNPGRDPIYPEWSTGPAPSRSSKSKHRSVKHSSSDRGKEDRSHRR